MKDARLVTSGDDGVRVWRWNEAGGSWEPEAIDQTLPADAEAPRPLATTAAALAATPCLAESASASASAVAVVRDVAWKPWDGIAETLASASGCSVFLWSMSADGGKWQADKCITLGEEVWKLSWAEMGNILLVSFGQKDQRTALLKQRLDGEWDIMDVAVQEH